MADRDLSSAPIGDHFGTAVDLTAAEVSVEAFLPADDSTAQWLTARSPVANPGLPAG